MLQSLGRALGQEEMMRALRLFWTSVRLFYEEAFLMGWVSLLWLLLSLPVVTAPLAAAGLFHVAYFVADDRVISWRAFFTGARRLAGPAYLLALLNGVAYGLGGINLNFYGAIDAVWAAGLQGFILALLVLWTLIQVYVFPMLLVQEKPDLRLALRNAALFLGAHLGLTLGLVVLLALLALVTLYLALPLLFLVVGLGAVAANRAVVEFLRSRSDASEG